MAVSPQQQATQDGASAAPSVSTELEAIFLGATGLPSSRAARLAPNRKVRSFASGGRRATRIPVATFGAIAAAALLGLSAGAVILHRPAATPTPLAFAAPPPAAAAGTPPLVVTLAGAGGSTTDLSAPKIRRIGDRRPAALHAARPTHADLLLADRRLRRAYARAIDAGVPRPVLVSYRDRWADLRHDASWRPDRVAAGYGAMAGDLTRLSERRSAHHAQRRRTSPGWR